MATNENVNVEKTEGLDLIWKLQADPANVVVSSTAAGQRCRLDQI